jgi:hypothetical protein
MPEGKGYLIREGGRKNDIEGFETIGTRETIVTSPGALGNDEPVVLTKEF